MIRSGTQVRIKRPVIGHGRFTPSQYDTLWLVVMPVHGDLFQWSCDDVLICRVDDYDCTIVVERAEIEPANILDLVVDAIKVADDRPMISDDLAEVTDD